MRLLYFLIISGYFIDNIFGGTSTPMNSEWLNAEIDRCTTIITGKLAGVSGPMTTHTSDCSNCDFRINKVPAMDWKDNDVRPLYLYKGEYPSQISSNRGNTWLPTNLEGTEEQLKEWGKESIITGYIPQVKHTYALLEAGYGIMNEHQVAIGESTCAARFWSAPVTAGGKALLEVRQLSQIALERTTTARDAIKLMGTLAEKYGFYAADWSGGDASKGEGGEALTVVDKTEAWIFHILADDTGSSAIWVAQRVPDDHISVVANQFVIRGINTKSADFMYSSNIFDVAKRQNIFTEINGQLDFLKTFAPPRAHSAYATRRVWRVFNLAAPSVNISPFTDAYGSDYPFSVKVDKQLTPQNLMDFNRDHYEGTQFDLTKGIAAGPYGDPNRFDMAAQPADNLTIIDILQGSYERSISLFRTSYSFVACARNVPDIFAFIWFSQYAPSSSTYAPIYIASEIIPLSYTRGTLFKYDSTVAFWNFCAAGNYASRFYKFAMTEIFSLQKELSDYSIDKITKAESTAMDIINHTSYNGVSFGNSGVIAILTAVTNEVAANILLSWRDLLPKLITKYHDGYRAEDLDKGSIQMVKLFYPKFWLDATGYFNSKINTGPDVIMFQPSMNTNDNSLLIFTAIISSIISLFGGFYIAKKFYYNNRFYTAIV